MRTLKPPPRQKKPVKVPPKKPSKSVFQDPFHYKIQIIPHEANQELIDSLQQYFSLLRTQMPEPEKKDRDTGKRTFISFNSSTERQYDITIGVKQNLQQIKQVRLMLIFYEESCHARLERLMCSVLYHETPYILMRPEERLRKTLGVRKGLAVGLKDQGFANGLQKHCSKCLIEIPWLVTGKWLPLARD